MNPIGVGPRAFSGVRRHFTWRVEATVFWLPAVAALAAPTRAEMGSGLDLRHVLSGIEGFRVEQIQTEYADVQLGATVQRSGSVAFAASALSFYDDLVDTTARTYTAPGLTGFVALLPYGDTPGKRMEVWPVETMAHQDKPWEWQPNEAAQFVVPCVITGLPELNAKVPAA